MGEEGKTYGVLIVEDARIVKNALKARIEESDRYRLIDAIENAANAEIACMSGKIDLVLMDVCTAEDESGLKYAEKLKDFATQKYPIDEVGAAFEFAVSHPGEFRINVRKDRDEEHQCLVIKFRFGFESGKQPHIFSPLQLGGQMSQEKMTVTRNRFFMS